MARQTKKKVLIVAGGTGGHVMPGLAVAEQLRQQADVELAWLGTRHGIEAELVPKAGITLFFLPVSGLRGKSRWQQVKGIGQLMLACMQTMVILLKWRPHLLLGLGGYASGPAGLVAALLRVPLVIHEQNAIAGLTNKLLARVATRVCQAFPQTFPAATGAILTGNPVRQMLCDLPTPKQRWQEGAGRLRVLVLGGSLGALVLNQMLPPVLAALNDKDRPDLWHQTGKKHLDMTRMAYANYGLQVRTEAFIDDMAMALAWAELVICRAGALTIAELSCVGVASILIPYPHAVDDHQTHNANYLVTKGAAILLPQAELTQQKLVQLLMEFINSKQTLKQMAEAAYQLPGRDAASLVSQLCLEVVQ